MMLKNVFAPWNPSCSDRNSCETELFGQNRYPQHVGSFLADGQKISTKRAGCVGGILKFLHEFWDPTQATNIFFRRSLDIMTKEDFIRCRKQHIVKV